MDYWADIPDTPSWAVELLQEMNIGPGDSDTRTMDVVHRQAEVTFLIRILTTQPPDIWAEWASSEFSPSWMRSAIAEYSVSQSRWEQVSHIARLELLEEILDGLLSDDLIIDTETETNST